MFNRRKFLGSSMLASAGLVLRTPAMAVSSSAGNPIVISTWDFGKAANEAAWKILSSKGRALDAVEAGVMIPEADPSNHSVGYGGLPDRDGHVTLDACIMDENSNCGSVMCLEFISSSHICCAAGDGKNPACGFIRRRSITICPGQRI